MSFEAAEEKAICGHSMGRTKKKPHLVLGENELKLPKRKRPFGARQQPTPPQTKTLEPRPLPEKDERTLRQSRPVRVATCLLLGKSPWFKVSRRINVGSPTANQAGARGAPSGNGVRRHAMEG
jgi:hypothetical protein